MKEFFTRLVKEVFSWLIAWISAALMTAVSFVAILLIVEPQDSASFTFLIAVSGHFIAALALFYATRGR